MQDFIMWLVQRSGQQEANAIVKDRFEAMGLAGVLEAWQARRAADERLLEVVADCVAQAKDAARIEAESEIKALQKGLSLQERELAQAQEKMDNASQDLASAKKDIEAEKAGKLDLRQKLLDLETRFNALQAEKENAELERKKEGEEKKREIDRLGHKLSQMENSRGQAEKLLEALAEAKLKIARLEATVDSQKAALAGNAKMIANALGAQSPQKVRVLTGTATVQMPKPDQDM